jgi:peptidoglycan L-alanyl-D-glutamate endopeptidase CwlK
LNGDVHIEASHDSTIIYLIVVAIATCVALLGLFFPEAVAALRRWGRERTAASMRRGVDRVRMARGSASKSWRATWLTIRRVAYDIVVGRKLASILAGLALIPPLLALAYAAGTIELDGFERQQGTSKDSMPVVAALLEGEHLAPPLPLPPELFTSRDVVIVRPALATASRAWELLDDAFSQKLLQVYRSMKDQYGYEMVLLEGYRSPGRQNELAAAGSHVTSAAAWQSYHQYGLAADSVFLKDGRVVISERDPWAMRGYQLFGEVAASAGLTWGGNWKMADFGHVEWRRPEARSRATL